MELKTLKFVMPAQYAAILENKNPEQIRLAIDNGTYVFGKVYKGRGRNVYTVATIPLLTFLGITEEMALTALRKAGIDI